MSALACPFCEVPATSAIALGRHLTGNECGKVTTEFDDGLEPNQVVAFRGVEGLWKVRRLKGYEVEVIGPVGEKNPTIRVFWRPRLAPAAGSDEAVAERASALRRDDIREAIARDGRVVVPLDDTDDAAERKRLSNMIFSRAYTLGLKGRFRVRHEGGKLIGERTDG